MYLSPAQTAILSKLANCSPTLQRATIGATGLVLQTTIDATNPSVDESTRKYAAIRTAVKMIVTTTGGIIFREIGQKLIGQKLVDKKIMEVPAKLIKEAAALSAKERLIQAESFKSISYIKKALANKNVSAEILAKAKFANAVGMVTAVAVAVISVFIFDMPFVNKIMNFVLDKIYGKDRAPKSAH